VRGSGRRPPSTRPHADRRRRHAVSAARHRQPAYRTSRQTSSPPRRSFWSRGDDARALAARPEPPPKPFPPPPRARSAVTQAAHAAQRACRHLRWSVLIGGLVIIVDLGTQAIQQRTAPSPDAIGELSTANLIANIVLFSILGAAVARKTGIFYLAALAGLLASILDGIVVATAASRPRHGEGCPRSRSLLPLRSPGRLRREG
jgi:hypothetical protein